MGNVKSPYSFSIITKDHGAPPWGSDTYTPPPAEALIYELTFTGDTPNNMSAGDPMENGGYILFSAGAGATGVGWNSTNITTVDVVDPLFGSVKALRDTYFANDSPYIFGNQTLFIKHPEMAKFYMSMRIRWSANWQWGDDQLKFCKNTTDIGPTANQVSTNCPKFDADGDAYITRLVPTNPSSNDQSVNAVAKNAQTSTRTTDDINNNFGGPGIDANWTPVLDQWYTVAQEIDAVAPGATTGYHKIWIDEVPYMEMLNSQVSEVGDTLFTQHELGHVWQGSVDPTVDIHMDWHSITIRTSRPE